MAAKSCRGLPAELAARQVVKIIQFTLSPPPKKCNKLKALLFRKKSCKSANKLSRGYPLWVSWRNYLKKDQQCLLKDWDMMNQMLKRPAFLFVPLCQANLAPNEGISVHAGSIFSTSSKPWQGPFLCADCRNKKDAMEGKKT
ncbi:hypothetical protein DH2020_032154 [Rehmannia glutinosa]|uniref:Uncharacterized protein n=1 Tax=Rehmannia glutinosa TaxID=99300 RepID=A0ABR0VIV6_REHGL